MIPATQPLFDVARTEPDPLAAAIRRIVPQASRAQVLDLQELIAAEAERIASPARGRGLS